MIVVFQAYNNINITVCLLFLCQNFLYWLMNVANISHNRNMYASLLSYFSVKYKFFESAPVEMENNERLVGKRRN